MAEEATTPGHSLNFAYQRKVRGFTEERVLHFCPWWWSLLGDVLVKKLGAALARQNGQVGKRKEAPPLGTAWHPAEAGKCRNPGKPSSHSPCTLHLHATFEWTKLQLILNVPWLHCAQFNKYASINLLNHKLQFGLEQVGETE